MSAVFELYTPEGATEAVEFVRITLPKGDMLVADETFREATDEDRRRFELAYADFKKGAKPTASAPVEVKDADPKKLPEPPPDFMPGFAEGEETKTHSHKKHK